MGREQAEVQTHYRADMYDKTIGLRCGEAAYVREGEHRGKAGYVNYVNRRNARIGLIVAGRGIVLPMSDVAVRVLEEEE